MCGLAGWYCFDNNVPSKELAAKLLLSIESRGTDATGLATAGENGKVQVLKGPFLAKEFVESQEFKDLPLGKITLFHTRSKTKGSEYDNHNNHPISSGGWVVTHNGTVKNDDDIFTNLSLERKGDVDSEAIPAILSGAKNFDDVKELIRPLEGQNTFLAISSKFPGQLLIAKGGKEKPLWLAVTPSILMWSSSADLWDIAPAPNFLLWKRLMWEDHPNDSVTIIKPKTIQRQKIDFLSWYESKRLNWKTFQEKQQVVLDQLSGVRISVSTPTELATKAKEPYFFSTAIIQTRGKKGGIGKCPECKKDFDKRKWMVNFFQHEEAVGFVCPYCKWWIASPAEWELEFWCAGV